eukprot:13772985-Alexandrium_andersonii.AAC.1
MGSAGKANSGSACAVSASTAGLSDSLPESPRTVWTDQAAKANVKGFKLVLPRWPGSQAPVRQR